jgi:hypothetical protein
VVSGDKQKISQKCKTAVEGYGGSTAYAGNCKESGTSRDLCGDLL